MPSRSPKAPPARAVRRGIGWRQHRAKSRAVEPRPPLRSRGAARRTPGSRICRIGQPVPMPAPGVRGSRSGFAPRRRSRPGRRPRRCRRTLEVMKPRCGVRRSHASGRPWPSGALESTVELAMDHEQDAVQASPDDEVPGGSVPEAAEEHRDQRGCTRVRLGPAAIAAERDVEVVAQPGGQRDVPAPPEVRTGSRER